MNYDLMKTRLKIERIKGCHGSLKVKTFARKAEDPWFVSRQWRILFFSNFPENLKMFPFAPKKDLICTVV